MIKKGKEVGEVGLQRRIHYIVRPYTLEHLLVHHCLHLPLLLLTERSVPSYGLQSQRE